MDEYRTPDEIKLDEYQNAQDKYVAAYNELTAAAKAYQEAQIQFYAATEQLAKLEAKPGTPA